MAALAAAFLLGAFVGSFLNVCIHRLPRNESVVAPGSRCYACGTAVRWYDNVPLASWLALRGRCRWCGTRFSICYWLGELGVAALTAVVVWFALWRLPGYLSASGAEFVPHWLAVVAIDPRAYGALAAGALLVVAWYLWVAAWIDVAHTIIPDELTKPLQAVAPLLAVALPLNLAFGWAPLGWFTGRTLGGDVQGTPLAGAGWLAAVAIPLLVLLLASVPLARWIYRRFCPPSQRWRDEDHRGFRIGVWWFAAAIACHLLLVLAVALAAQAGDPGSRFRLSATLLAMQLAQAVLGALAGWFALYLVGLVGTMAFRRNALGFGDVKLLAPVGAVVGPVGVLYVFFLAALAGSVIGIPHRLLGRGREIPFGPFLALGAAATLVAGPALHAWLFDRLF